MLIGLCVLVILGATTTARAQHQADLDDLFELYDIAGIPADFVVVLDTSASMSFEPDPLYPRVLEALALLIDAIDDGDHLAFLTFDAVVGLEFDGDIDGTTPDEVLGGLPEVAPGQATDIGAGIEAALRRLDRTRHSGVQIVVFLTDGIHNAPEGSPYPDDLDAPAWQALRDEAVELERSRRILAFGVGLEGGDATDVTPLQRIFSTTEVVNLPPEQLAPFFTEVVDRARLERLRLEVAADLETTVLQGQISDELVAEEVTTIPVRLRWEESRLPATVEVVDVTVTDASGADLVANVVEPGPRSIDPGDEVVVEVAVEGLVDQQRIELGETVELFDLEVVLDVEGRVEPERLLATTIGVDPDLGARQVTADAQIGRTSGIPWRTVLIVLGLALLLAIVLWWAYRRYLRIPPLVGALQLPDGEMIELRGRRLELPEDPEQLPGAGTGRAELFTRRGEAGRVYVRALSQPVSIDRFGAPEPVTEPARLRYHEQLRLGMAAAQYVRRR